jgi:hypothetical protein
VDGILAAYKRALLRRPLVVQVRDQTRWRRVELVRRPTDLACSPVSLGTERAPVGRPRYARAMSGVGSPAVMLLLREA